MKILYFIFFIYIDTIIGMDQNNEIEEYKKRLFTELKLSRNATICHKNNSIMVADVRTSYDLKRKKIKNTLLLAYTQDTKDEIVAYMHYFYFPSKNILPCYGTLYSTAHNNVFYQAAVQSCLLENEDSLLAYNTNAYIVEYGFTIPLMNSSSKYIYEYKLFLDINLDGSGQCTSVIDFITFPALLKAILAASPTGKVVNKEDSLIKIIQDVILPENYKKLRHHPWCPFSTILPFDKLFGTIFRTMCEEKYEKQEK